MLRLPPLWVACAPWCGCGCECGCTQFGVHIADVAFFVEPGSFLDAEARTRGTTCYMVTRRFDMLPPTLRYRHAEVPPGTPQAHPKVPQGHLVAHWRPEAMGTVVKSAPYCLMPGALFIVHTLHPLFLPGVLFIAHTLHLLFLPGTLFFVPGCVVWGRAVSGCAPWWGVRTGWQ